MLKSARGSYHTGTTRAPGAIAGAPIPEMSPMVGLSRDGGKEWQLTVRGTGGHTLKLDIEIRGTTSPTLPGEPDLESLTKTTTPQH